MLLGRRLCCGVNMAEGTANHPGLGARKSSITKLKDLSAKLRPGSRKTGESVAEEGENIGSGKLSTFQVFWLDLFWFPCQVVAAGGLLLLQAFRVRFVFVTARQRSNAHFQ